MRLAYASMLATVICVTSTVPAAQACPPQSSFPSQRLAVLPESGAQAVPLNTRVFVRLDRHDREGYQVRLRPLGGEVIATSAPVALADDVFVLPSAALEPDTTYEILDNVDFACAEGQGCFGDAFTVIASFTTGSEPDLDAPGFAGPLHVSEARRVVEFNSCASIDAMIFTLDWDAAVDASPVWYEVLFQDAAEPVSRRLLEPGASGGVSCGGGGGDFRATGGGSYTVRATDLSGNVSVSSRVLVDIVCTDLPPDAGVAPDATIEAPLDEDGGGCGCRVGRRSSAPAGWPLALVALVGLRRGRRRPSF